MLDCHRVDVISNLISFNSLIEIYIKIKLNETKIKKT